MHITLRQLEVFAEVLKSGSTTQASQMLALSQSAVSAALTISAIPIIIVYILMSGKIQAGMVSGAVKS